MVSTFDINEDQITFRKQLVYHFYLGIVFTLFYASIGPHFVARGYPGLTGLLFAELFVLAPIALGHLYHKGKQLNGSYSLKNVISYTNRISKKDMVIWSLGGIATCFLVFLPLYPLGLVFRESLFGWLPEWYFNPGFGSVDNKLIAKLFLIGIFVDGIIGPVAEELFFRGYLLPRMTYLKNWAPVINGAFFGLYHFWQPHNFIGLVLVGIILSYIVWKKKNIYLGIIIHCTLNILGSIGGFLAASNGVMIDR